MTVPEAVTIRMSEATGWTLALACTAVGAAIGLGVAPLVGWLLSTVADAPVPLRLLATLPTPWAVLVTAVLGAGVGIWLAGVARKEALTVSLDDRHVELLQDGRSRYVGRDDVEAVFRDGKDLVFLDARTAELARAKASDLPADRLRAAFERFGYPWRGNCDPHEGEFRRWVDGHPALAADVHGLLRARGRALRAKEPDAAAELHEQLQARGVLVRDRGGTQEYRGVGG